MNHFTLAILALIAITLVALSVMIMRRKARERLSCKACKTRNREEALYCARCGAKLGA